MQIHNSRNLMKTPLLLLACFVAAMNVHAANPARPEIQAAVQAHRDGRHDEALRLIQQQFKRIATSANDSHVDFFITMFEWKQLVGDFAAARTAMISERDEQVRRIFDGDTIFCADGFMPISRLRVIVEMNETLQDSRSTYRVITQLLTDHSELVRNDMHRALPAIVEAGDYALAIQHIKNPLSRLDELNRMALELPLYPPAGKGPRLAAELSGLIRNVALLDKALKGQGKDAEAEALRHAALTGIQSDQLRALATRELAEPGAITKAVVEHQMAQAAESPAAAGP
ncbi:hypothetical protein GJ700_19805 [Duganella sp. FT92W]|uniref:Uncharacterized protein n=1 Tax=Pseudoduganella rivuli TaxID=2666085 RepID=A0A7X2IQJ3_9BURK|nr:hypothetical protein [Pseudoduganella rivuli]MRV73957.1 hypothetical protein [Pseudoduganella rivuli]